MDRCYVPNVSITTAPKGFVDASVFITWILYFRKFIPECGKIDILLVYGVYKSHYSPNIVAKAMYLESVIFLFHVNATHMINPLDIPILKPF